MPYIEISIITSSDEAERIADGLHELNALSVTLEDAQDNALFQLQPEEMPLWSQVRIKALFDETISPRDVISQLKFHLNRQQPINYRIKKIADQDWVRLTQQHFKPQCYANLLWICPSWHQTPVDGKILRIDPGLAFGTGTHPTTHLCLDWLAHNPPHDQIVIDYGCGSGILALAAATLGASHVYATDHDEQALLATHNNTALNQHIQAPQLTVCAPELLPDVKAHVIIANILANPLITLEPIFVQHLKPHGVLVLSGILEHEFSAIHAVYQKNFTLLDTQIKEQWLCLTWQRM